MPDIQDFMAEAAALCRRQECEAGIGSLEGAAQLAPQDWRIHLQLGLCFSGGCRSHSLVSSEAALHHLDMALSSLPRSASRSERASVLAALGNTLPGAQHLPLKTRAVTAIASLEKAAAIYESMGRREDWARQQYNLANAWCECPIESFPDKWERAIRHYEEALRVWTRGGDPQRHARILQNLGTAWRELERGDRAWNRWKALRCFHPALQFCRTKHLHCNAASIHNNIGNVFLSTATSPPGQRIRHAHTALRHFEQALQLLNQESEPHVCAVTQFNRGQALLLLAVHEFATAQTLCQARAAFEESRRAFLAQGEVESAQRATEHLQTVDLFLSAIGAQPGIPASGGTAALCSDAAHPDSRVV